MAGVAQTPTALIDGPLDDVFWGGRGSGSSSQVPNPYMIAINGRPYLEDLEFKPWKRQAMRATTTTITRTQADTSNEPGEQSLSTDSLWRRTQDSWHLGAGQVFLDRKNSQEFAFRSSKGINPWTQWQMTLLNDTTQALSSSNNNNLLAVCGTHLYVLDGQALKFTTDLSSWTTVTGTPAVTPSSICSDGHTVWVAYGASGIYSTTEGASSASQYTSTAIASTAVVRFVLGRLMLGTNNLIYNITGSGALPGSPLSTSLYGNLVWNDFAAGNGVIFASGNSGNVGVVYSIQILPDGTSLASPIVCGQLPNGENVEAIYGYAGSGLAIGTSLGFRFTEQALANGVAGTVALTIGPLFQLPSPVLCFSGYGRFIWGGYTAYDAVSTGLFRMDPTQFVSDLAPAYATDLMVTGQGAVNSLVHFNGSPVFAVQGLGVYYQATTYVASGTFDSGLITYDLADNKMPVFVDDQMVALASGQSIQSLVSLNGAAFTPVGTSNILATTFTEFQTPQTLSQTIEIRKVLTAGTSQLTTPTLLRHTLRSIPNPPVPTDWTIVVQLRERCRAGDIEYAMVPSFEYAFLDGLRQECVICQFQIGTTTFAGFIYQIDYIPEQRGSPTGEMNGVAVITARTVA